jgi:DNA-binding response OmpR family regulator
MTKRNVLFADNDPDYLDTRSEQLEGAGFIVFKAGSFEEAEQILHEQRIHLAIIDLRLRDDGDDRDTSGLTLAKKEVYSSVPKIILTRFPSYEYVREALGPALTGLPPAVDFLAKQEGSKVMMQAIEKAFTRHIRINWNLTIQQGEQLSFSHLASLIELGLDSADIMDRAGGLEDLFRRLFYNSTQITLGRLLVRRQKWLALTVFTFSAAGTENQFVVACGQREYIQQEDQNYDTFVPKAIGEGGTVKVNSAQTVHFAATAYMLTGGDLEEMSTFVEFYRGNSVEAVIGALDHLFNTTLEPWYKKGRFREEEKMLHEFLIEWLELNEKALTQAELEPRLEAICRETLTTGLAQLDYSSHKLTIHLPDGSSVSYPNLASCLSEIQMGATSSILCGVTHGWLNGSSILTDSQGRTWLVDFNQVGQAPLMRDFVSLEMAIRAELWLTSTIQTCYEMERRLMAVSRLDEAATVEGLETEVQKALQTINRVRRQAELLINHDLDAYLMGLLFYVASQLTKYNPEVRYNRRQLGPYLHSLLLAGMLCKKLIAPPPEDLPPQASYSLWIDENRKEAWVEGRKIKLAPGEYDFLKVLYHRANRLCTRQDISKELFGMDHGRETEDAINATMTRLRKKIEYDPKRPKYIITVRGEGYKLELDNPPV